MLGIQRRLLHGPRAGVQMILGGGGVGREDDDIAQLPFGNLANPQRLVIGYPAAAVR